VRNASILAAVTGAMLVLSACGSDGSDGSGDGSGQTDSATTDSGLVITGEPGSKPQIDIPDEEPPGELVTEVLEQGDGEEVAAGELLVANYLGQTWEPTEQGEPNVFDNSYDRGAPASFPIGTGMVIEGWDQALVGQPIGSRVAVSIPPEQGYGEQGTEGIPANSTLVFVVEITDSYGVKDMPESTPVEDPGADVPTVSGEPGSEPTIEVPEDIEPPESSDAVLLAEGSGEPLEGNLVANVVQADFQGETQYSSWQPNPQAQGEDVLNGPQSVPAAQLPGLAEALEGQGAGARALVRISAADNPSPEGGEGEPLLLLIDVLGSTPVPEQPQGPEGSPGGQGGQGQEDGSTNEGGEQ